jgi:hypothetical protein
MLEQWWNYDIPSKNFHDFLEQDALWHMLESPKYYFLFNSHTVTVLLEPQFPSMYFGVNDLWVCHVPDYMAHNRPIYFMYL